MGVVACAGLLRVSERTIRGWESGETRIPYAAYKLLRVLKGGRYLAHPLWKDFVIQGDVLVTPEGHRFQAGELGWWSLLVRQACAFREVLRDRRERDSAGLPARPADPAETASALGLVSSSTSDPRPTPKTGSAGENKGSGTGQLVAARRAEGQGSRHQQVGRLARVLRSAGGAA